MRTHGFSLVELAACLLVMAVLALVAMPGFARLLESNRASVTSNLLLGIFSQARVEALRRRSQVGICPSPDARYCLSATDWSQGLISYVDGNRNGRRDADELILRVLTADDFAGMRLLGTPGRSNLGYRRDGRAAGINATLRLCSRDNRLARKIIVNTGGRVRIEPSDGPAGC